MSNYELRELFIGLGFILLTVYMSFSLFLVLMLISNRMILTWTDDKEHSNKEYIFTVIGVIIFWPFLLIKSEISKEDK